MPIDILSGDSRLREWLSAQSGLTEEQITALCSDGVHAWEEQSKAFWLYEI